MLNNYCLRDKDNRDNKKKFCTNATEREVGRVVTLVCESDKLNMSRPEAVMKTLQVLGFEVLDGVHYDEVYTL